MAAWSLPILKDLDLPHLDRHGHPDSTLAPEKSEEPLMPRDRYRKPLGAGWASALRLTTADSTASFTEVGDGAYIATIRAPSQDNEGGVPYLKLEIGSRLVSLPTPVGLDWEDCWYNVVDETPRR